MHTLNGIHLADVQAVYSGAEGRLWELLMGEQIHIGGLQSSLDLAERAVIPAGGRGVDFCCCTGAGMRFLLRFRNVAHMTGVDATPAVLALARQRATAEGVTDRTTFVEANVCASGLADGSFDFVWGEDAWFKIIGFDQALAGALLGEMRFLQSLAEAGQIIQGLIVAQKGK